jgi:hypothetical protein
MTKAERERHRRDTAESVISENAALVNKKLLHFLFPVPSTVNQPG